MLHFPGTVILVLASLPVHNLTLVVYVLVVVWESLKFEGGTVVVMVPRQYFQLSNCAGLAAQLNRGNIIFASCRSMSCASRFLFDLDAVPQSWQ